MTRCRNVTSSIYLLLACSKSTRNGKRKSIDLLKEENNRDGEIPCFCSHFDTKSVAMGICSCRNAGGAESSNNSGGIKIIQKKKQKFPRNGDLARRNLSKLEILQTFERKENAKFENESYPLNANADLVSFSRKTQTRKKD